MQTPEADVTCRKVQQERVVLLVWEDGASWVAVVCFLHDELGHLACFYDGAGARFGSEQRDLPTARADRGQPVAAAG